MSGDFNGAVVGFGGSIVGVSWEVIDAEFFVGKIRLLKYGAAGFRHFVVVVVLGKVKVGGGMKW